MVSIVCLIFVFIISCTTDDIDSTKSILKYAKKENLYGVWSIYKVESQGRTADVPVNIQECGRDFFIYRENQEYDEFLFQESATCKPTQNKLKWALNNGIITLSDFENTGSQIVTINSLSATNFVFTAMLDFDGDNVNEPYTFTAYRYLPPNEFDIYTSSFTRVEEPMFSSHIEFKWNQYNGYNSFIKYEIFRSNDGCSVNSAQLIKTIEDVNLTSFIDENPPVAGSFCYFLKIYTDEGLLGESNAWYINTESIIPKNVAIVNSSYNDNSITISWEKYTGYYFSHYEIRVQDQNTSSSYNVQTVKIIEDVNVTSFTDFNPPYVNNPVYSIYVHNIFGNSSPLDMTKNMIKIGFTRDEILDFNNFKFLSFDAQSKSFFLYGKSIKNEMRLVKYDYLNKKIAAEAFKMPTSSTDTEMKLITSENGKELLFVQGGDLWVYDASNLIYKYALKPNNSLVNSFAYLSNNIWVVADGDYVKTYKRNGSEFLKIDEKLHFPDHQGSFNYEITKMDANTILLSHNNEGRAIQYTINSEGQITNNGIKQLPMYARYNSDIAVNNSSNLILNKNRNTIYSSVNYSVVASYPNPVITLNFNKLGTKIFGTNNDVGTNGNYNHFKKELVVYDISNQGLSKLATKGYPLYVAEDDVGNIVSLSSGFPRTRYYDYRTSDVADLFVEIIK
ncbi:hypothetical protein ACGK9U_09665 [Mariniflexile sp. HNIBRBA6329]|uniref:hypothetical protein n=1 Tax=Mariniflexile sp. HNIBRBA6329 TaxID=3373088 RepID=UPI0037450638